MPRKGYEGRAAGRSTGPRGTGGRPGPSRSGSRLADVEGEARADVVRAVVVEADPELGHEVEVVVDLVLDARHDVCAREVGVGHVVERLEREVEPPVDLEVRAHVAARDDGGVDR